MIQEPVEGVCRLCLGLLGSNEGLLGVVGQTEVAWKSGKMKTWITFLRLDKMGFTLDIVLRWIKKTLLSFLLFVIGWSQERFESNIRSTFQVD